MPPSTAVRIALAVMGGWLAVMPHAVLTIALRLRELDATGLPGPYSTTLAVGWLALMAGLVGFGVLGDALERRGRPRRLLLLLSAPAIVVSGVALSLASSPGTLAVAWVLAQLPAAAAVATALAVGGTAAPAQRRGLLSAMVGAAPILALLVGGAVARALSAHPSWTFATVSVVGALLIVPLARHSPRPGEQSPPADRRADRSTRRFAPAWVAFALASFLLSWATSATNGYVVLFIDRLAGVTADDVAATASTIVTLAAVIAVLASLGSALLVRGRRSGAGLWSVAALGVAGALALLLFGGGMASVVVGAALFGAGFGLANGAELGVLLFVRHRPGRLGRDLGVFTAVTTLPYVLVPAVGAALLAPDVSAVLRLLFGASAVFAVVGALITAGIAVRSPRRAGRDQQTEPEAG